MKESPSTYALAGIGAVGGAWRYYVKPELTAGRAWLAIGALVSAYEFTCPDKQTLSEGVDRAIEAHPIITTAAIGYTAAHLCNVLPEQFDLFHRVTNFKH